MIAVFACLSASYSNCTQAPQDLTFSIKEGTLGADSWEYFYSHHNLNNDRLTIKVYTKDNDLVLYTADGIQCPDNKTETKMPVSDDVLVHEVNVNNELGILNFALRNTGSSDANYIISVQGNDPNNFDSQSHVVLIGIFLALAILLLILFFVHSILARDKVYYKVDVQE